MERKKRLSKRTASVRIEPYLAEYIQKKLEIEPETGGVKIPYTTDLYHVVWNCMAKPDSHHDVMQDCNLKIYLPSRRSKMDGHPGKDPLTSIIHPVMRRKNRRAYSTSSSISSFIDS